MKSNRLIVPLTVVLLAGCAGSSPRPAESSAPAPTPTPAPKTKTSAGFPLDPEEQKHQEETMKRVEEIKEKVSERAKEGTPDITGEGEIVVDPATGKKQQRIEKSVSYSARGGRLYMTMLGDRYGFPILREDDKAWYIEPPTKKKSQPTAERQAVEALPKLLPMPPEEAEVVTPKRTAEKLRLEEISQGLPDEGMWRENFALADLDGDGRPEIVSTPPRLSGRDLQIFKWNGKEWVRPDAKFDDPERVGFEYGGVACADMDGDGKIDIVYGHHGGGPAIAFNKGDFHFSIETRGLPKEMSTRALAIGDLDGDGHPDIVAISDEPEWALVRRSEGEGNMTARLPRASGYLPGVDTRAFLWRNGRYEEAHAGLEESCYGYSIGLSAAPADGGDPFFATGCRYNANPGVVYAFDRAARRFVRFPWQIAEAHALHNGTAIGNYQGHPAAFVAYSKANPSGGTPNISGYGVSIYWRDGATWKRTRILKALREPATPQGIAVGDLNGDGLDDVAFADDVEGRLRIFLQRKDGSFEEIAQELEPTYVNHATAVRIADVDGDGRPDIVMSYQPLTGDATRSGGFRVFRNR